jgi:hypothetical protein
MKQKEETKKEKIENQIKNLRNKIEQYYLSKNGNSDLVLANNKNDEDDEEG